MGLAAFVADLGPLSTAFIAPDSTTRGNLPGHAGLAAHAHFRPEAHHPKFVVEDLHWVDASTLEFLGQFLAEGLHDRMLTVLTFRPEFQTPWPALGHQTSLALTRLTRRQVGDLKRKKTGIAVPEALVEQIYDRAGGVPLFAEEFTKMVQEPGCTCRFSSAFWVRPTRRPAGSGKLRQAADEGLGHRGQETTTGSRRPNCTASRASCSWPSRPNKRSPPRTPSARPSKWHRAP